MAKRLFNQENLLWQLMGHLGDLIILSLLWVVCCLPVVTIGSATTALYDTVIHSMRRGEDPLFIRFFATLKHELLSGILSTLLWAAIAAAAWLLQTALGSAVTDPHTRSIVLIFYRVLVTFFLLCAAGWVFPLLSRFTFGFAALNRTALRLAFGHILRSSGIAVLIIITVLLCWLLAIPLFFMPALCALLCSYLIEPVFQQYEKPADSD